VSCETAMCLCTVYVAMTAVLVDKGRGALTNGHLDGEVLNRGPPPDVVPGRPAAAEVPVLDEHVGRDDVAPVGRRDDGAVVAGADERGRRGGQQREDPGEERLLGHVADQQGRLAHAATLAAARPVTGTVRGPLRWSRARRRPSPSHLRPPGVVPGPPRVPTAPRPRPRGARAPRHGR